MKMQVPDPPELVDESTCTSRKVENTSGQRASEATPVPTRRSARTGSSSNSGQDRERAAGCVLCRLHQGGMVE
jgi:hypothetical protein